MQFSQKLDREQIQIQGNEVGMNGKVFDRIPKISYFTRTFFSKIGVRHFFGYD